tara:strand:- start:358 stop:678 length:321 start_codon:yes stop_codon:yes gene_type:complete
MRSLSDSEVLLKAAMNRIAARITEKIANSAQELNEIAEELPEKLRSEWSSFKEEVIAESERIEKNIHKAKDKSSKAQLTKEDLIQIKIDNLRSKVIELNKDIEGKN